jgi:hypothetical protein
MRPLFHAIHLDDRSIVLNRELEGGQAFRRGLAVRRAIAVVIVRHLAEVLEVFQNDVDGERTVAERYGRHSRREVDRTLGLGAGAPC